MTASVLEKKATPEWPYKLLHPDEHSRLVDNLSEVLRVAGVRPDFIDLPLSDFCGKAEVHWVRNYRQKTSAERKGGFMIVGVGVTPDPSTRMQAMASAFIRNYIDARVINWTELIPTDMGAGDCPDPTVLLIPDFYRITGQGSPMSNWQVQLLQGILMTRFAAGRATVLHLDSVEGKDLFKVFGESLVTFLVSNWDLIKLD